MTMEQIFTLREVVRIACQEMPRCSVQQTVSWIVEHHLPTLDDNSLTLYNKALSVMVREERKGGVTPEITLYHENLCLDFGIEPTPFDREISIPCDLNNPVSGGCEWRELEEASIRNLDAHVILLRATAAANVAMAEQYVTLRNAAMRHNPDGDLDRTIGELRQLARGGDPA
jgi:hypothetical protein